MHLLGNHGLLGKANFFNKLNLARASFVLLLLVLQFSSGCKSAGDTSISNAANSSTANVAGSEAKVSDSVSKNTLCANAYNPIGAFLQRKYRITYANNSMPTQEYTESFSDLKADTFVVKSKFSNIETNINWRCTADGLLATQFDNNSMTTNSGVTAKVETVKSEGVSLPGESRWHTGEKWNVDYVIKETIQMPNSQMRPEGDGTVKGDGEILGEEQVTVPAGTYQATKTRFTYKFDVTVKTSGMTIPVPQISLETTAWFVKDVGMVKSITASNGKLAATTELLSISGQ